jgi:hypothetical protein
MDTKETFEAVSTEVAVDGLTKLLIAVSANLKRRPFFERAERLVGEVLVGQRFRLLAVYTDSYLSVLLVFHGEFASLDAFIYPSRPALVCSQ